MAVKVYVSLGSNVEGDAHLAAAREAVTAAFPDALFSAVLHTEPIGMRSTALFSNQVATFSTALPAEELRRRLKKMERQVAPVPKEKEAEQIFIDIDHLKWGETVLKPADGQRGDVVEAAAELS